MGKVVVKVKLTNYVEEQLKKLKLLKGKPRTVEIGVLVDTGATRLYLQSGVIRALGLRKEGEVVSRTTNGSRRRAVYQAARLELLGRKRGAPSRWWRWTTTCPTSSARFRSNTWTSSLTPRAKNSFPIPNTVTSR